jgi:predicted MFS family arabinose efflux permease
MTSIFVGGALGSAVASSVFEVYGWPGVVLVGSALPLFALGMFVLYGQRAAHHG